MWILYAVSGIFATVTVAHRLKLLFDKFYPRKYKTFEDENDLEDDEYDIICYRINLENSQEIVRSELDHDDIEKIEEDNKIISITIEYMFNGQFMKYLTYKKDITFPIYPFKVEPPKFKYYPESIFFNEINVTDYVTPYLGPLCNFYRDREEPISLKDALKNHPQFESFNFEEGMLIMISNDTPILGKKIIIKKCPCNLIWKRHAAVDPRDDYKLE